LTGAWIPNAVIVHMIDGSGKIDAPLALSSSPSVFSNLSPKIIPSAVIISDSTVD
jgi:hypothetical protein